MLEVAASGPLLGRRGLDLAVAIPVRTPPCMPHAPGVVVSNQGSVCKGTSSIRWAHGLRFSLPLELLEPKKFLPLGAPDGAE